MYLARFLLSAFLLACAVPAAAQVPSPPAAGGLVDDQFLGACTRTTQWQFEQVSASHLRLTGQVQIECPTMSFFADVIDIYSDPELRLVASGNVVFANPEGRIAAERVEYNMKTGIGTFHQASGLLALGDEVDPAEYLAHRGVDYPALVGTDQVQREYNVTAIPTIVVIGVDGRVVHRGTGWSASDERKLDRVLSAYLAEVGMQ